MHNKAEPELLDIVRQGLTGQCDRLPEETLRRLQVMRAGVLDKTAAPSRFYNRTIFGVPLTPLSAALSVGVLWGMLLMMPDNPLQQYTAGNAGEAVDMVDDVDVLMSTEDIEFLENLEIYEWLDAEYG
ncbi:MAG: hypothetical protein CSA79_01610 [Thiothrix nivea]|nr:MAG: hypothetical protein CSA79_01610 [Thiothrix nivea]